MEWTVLPGKAAECSFFQGLPFLNKTFKEVLCAFQIMKNIVRDCLKTAESLSLQSIGFPAIGTGNLGFPKPEFAKLIISEVLRFSSRSHLKTLQEVQFLLHPKDLENIQVLARLASDYFANCSLEPVFF